MLAFLWTGFWLKAESGFLSECELNLNRNGFKIDRKLM